MLMELVDVNEPIALHFLKGTRFGLPHFPYQLEKANSNNHSGGYLIALFFKHRPIEILKL